MSQIVKSRPYKFTGKWIKISNEELLETKLAQFGPKEEFWQCVTNNGIGIIFPFEKGWFGGVIDKFDDQIRFHWSTNYYHSCQILNYEMAKDLVEAALVIASIGGAQTIVLCGFNL